MDKSEFLAIAEQVLNNIEEKIENADIKGDLDIDNLNGVINLELPDNKVYIINKHEASAQIWLSSPFSGASHFSYKDNCWISSANENLFDLLAKELKPYLPGIEF